MMRESKGTYRCRPASEVKKQAKTPPDIKQTTYQLVDEQAKEIVFLFRFVPQQCKYEG
jgi:hypothetical protein